MIIEHESLAKLCSIEPSIIFEMFGKEITLGQISGSLGLIPNRIKYDIYDGTTSSTTDFGINEPCHMLLKEGNTSTELEAVERHLRSELYREYVRAIAWWRRWRWTNRNAYEFADKNQTFTWFKYRYVHTFTSFRI